MESIEVSKTISADVDANAPAGTINLRTKRAFDRSGRRWSWQANLAAHSEEFTFTKTPGPNDSGKTEKIRPGGILEYSDVFLNKRLGIVLNLSESNVYQETLISTLTYNRTPTATDLRPEVITQLSFQWAPRFNKRSATTLTADYKVSENLALSMGVVYNYADLWTPQRTVTFNTGARNTVQGDPYVNFVTTTGANVVANPVAVAKMGETTTLLPKFFYKRGNFDLEGKFAWSDATSWYDPLSHRESVRDANSPTANNVNFRVTRSSPQAMDFQITQISGPDIANGASYTSPAVSINDGRFSRSTLASGELVATLKTQAPFPVIWKTGVKDRYELRNFSDDQLTRRMDYLGAGTTPIATGAWANYRSAYEYDYGISNGSIRSISGGQIFMADLGGIAALYNSNPNAFRQNLPAANYYTAYVGNSRLFSEEIKSAFLMGTTPIGHATFRAGIRFEDTATDSLEPDPRSTAELKAFNLPFSNGRATTIPGLQYQFFSQPRVHRTGGFHNYFPSASFKEHLTQNLDFSLGYSTTIRRATYADLSGVYSVNDVNRTVTAPNANLKPETSKNLAARLAYYFEPVGQLGVTFFQNRVRDLQISQTISAAEFGNNDPNLAGYDFVTFTNSPTSIRLRGMEIEYSQALSFLPNPFKRLSVRGSYTRNYQGLAPGTAATPNLAPHQASAGLNYTFRRFSTNVNWTWSDDVPLTTTGLSYRRHRANLDTGASFSLTNHVNLSVSVRNLTNSAYINMQWVAPSAPVWTRNETTGVSWTFAIKGTY
jgi:TonB-dependent receptor